MKFKSFSHRQAREKLKSKLNTFREFREIIRNLTIAPFEKGDHWKIQNSFRSKGWKPEKTFAQKLFKKWRYDAFKDRVAVEINTRSPCYRSVLKFILGVNQGEIDVGIIIVYNDRKIPDDKHHLFSITERELKDLFTSVPVPILLIGLYP